MSTSPAQKLNMLALSQGIQEARESFTLRTEMFSVLAAEMKVKYDSLVSAGFTETQALELTKSKAF